MNVYLAKESDGRTLAENMDLCGGYAYGATEAEALAKIEELSAHCQTIDTREWREWVNFVAERMHNERDWNQFLAQWRESFAAKPILDALLQDNWKLTTPEGPWRVIEWPGYPEYRHHRTIFPFADSDRLGPVLLCRMAIHLELRNELIVR